MYLTKLLMTYKTQEKRQEILNIIKNGSIIIWHHINLFGEYDFNKTAKIEPNFNVEQILGFKVGV